MINSKLNGLKSQLKQLRDARDRVRLGIALSETILCILAALVGWFLIDYSLHLDPIHRLLMIAISLPAIVYGVSRAFTTLRGWRASLIETAISVEHRHGIDGDLVAALQFEQGASIGSSELQSAVVDYVAELKNEIDFFEGFNTRPLRNRLIAVTLATLIVFGVCISAPQHVSIFFQRLGMSRIHYPTKTRISQIELNGQSISLDGMAEPSTVGYGNPLDLRITLDGVLPRECRVVITDENGGVSETVLSPDATNEDEFHYAVQRLIQPIRYQVFAGDAATAEHSVEIIPLPILRVELAATPPPYAQNIQLSSTSNSTHLAVLAGSQVTMNVLANRALEAPNLLIRRAASEIETPLVPLPSMNNTWTLPESIDALNEIQETISYELTAVDEHGLSPASPVRGTIRVVPDRLPSANLQTIHHIVLPTASPMIRYRANDDFGLADLSFRLEIRRGDSVPRVIDVPWKQFSADAPPQRTVEGEYSLDLSQWNLEVGDQVQVKLRATDFRGNSDEMLGESDPLHLEIGDESSVLAAIAEADKQSEQMLSELIQQQLGLGENQ